MNEPYASDEAFLADVESCRAKTGELHLWWLGQSGFLLQWDGRHLLFDPYLSDSLTRKYAGTDKPHVRMTGRVVDPARLGFVDVVTSSHNHTDHLDGETLRPMMAANPGLRLVVPEANRAFVAARLQADPGWAVGLDAGESVTLAGFTLTAVPAAHETVDRDGAGRCHYLGYVVQAGPWKIYHSGDTVLYEGMAATLRSMDIDVALLPINGRAPERRVAGNLTGAEAARLAHEIGAGVVIPCHYDLFEFNTASPEEFVRTAVSLRQHYSVLRNGERWNCSVMQ